MVSISFNLICNENYTIKLLYLIEWPNSLKKKKKGGGGGGREEGKEVGVGGEKGIQCITFRNESTMLYRSNLIRLFIFVY